MSARGSERAVSFVTTVGLSMAALVLGSAILVRHDLRVDLTEGHRRTLAPQTRAVLERVERPIEALAFYADVPEERQILAALVERFNEGHAVLRLRFIDVDRDPALAQQYDVTANRTVVLLEGDLRVKVRDPDEGKLAAAILRVLQNEPPQIFFVTGHGEASVEDESRAGLQRAARMLAGQNFALRILNTSVIERIPAEADVLVLAAPEDPWTARERAMLTEYLLRGGRVLALLEPYGSPSADSLVYDFGVQPLDGFVYDDTPEQANLTRGGDRRIALAQGYDREHPITRGFGRAALFPLARGLQARQPTLPGTRPTRLLQTGEKAWVETTPPRTPDERPVFDPDRDRPGPVALAFAVEIALRRFDLFAEAEGDLVGRLLDLGGSSVDLRDTTLVDTLAVGDLRVARDLAESARLVVFGDADFAANANLDVQGNGDLLLASVLWLSEQDDRIALPARPRLSDPILLTARQLFAVRVVGIGVVPALFFLAAGWTLWRRRQWV